MIVLQGQFSALSAFSIESSIVFGIYIANHSTVAWGRAGWPSMPARASFIAISFDCNINESRNEQRVQRPALVIESSAYFSENPSFLNGEFIIFE